MTKWSQTCFQIKSSNESVGIPLTGSLKLESYCHRRESQSSIGHSEVTILKSLPLPHWNHLTSRTSLSLYRMLCKCSTCPTLASPKKWNWIGLSLIQRESPYCLFWFQTAVALWLSASSVREVSANYSSDSLLTRTYWVVFVKSDTHWMKLPEW